MCAVDVWAVNLGINHDLTMDLEYKQKNLDASLSDKETRLFSKNCYFLFIHMFQ